MTIENIYATEEENSAIIKAYFKEGTGGPLVAIPRKEKRKLVVLRQLINRFDPQRKYNETEVNDILKSAFHDYVMLRRYLIEYEFMDRYSDGSCYWVKV